MITDFDSSITQYGNSYTVDISGIELNDGTLITDLTGVYSIKAYYTDRTFTKNSISNPFTISNTPPPQIYEFIGQPTYTPTYLTWNFTTDTIDYIRLQTSQFTTTQIPITTSSGYNNNYEYTIDLSQQILNDPSSNTITNVPGIYTIFAHYTDTVSGSTTSDAFTIYTVNNTISEEWNTVLQDNIRLMKAGLYNTSVNDYHYIYPGEEPQDLSANNWTGTGTVAPLSSSLGNTLYFMDQYTSFSVDNTTVVDYLGINNSICNLQIGTTADVDYYIRTDSNYITLSEGNGYYKEFTATYKIVNNPQTITVVNDLTVAQYQIIGINAGYDSSYNIQYYNFLDIISEGVPKFYSGNVMTKPYSFDDNQTMVVNYNNGNYDEILEWIDAEPLATIEGAYVLNPTNINEWAETNYSPENFVLRIRVKFDTIPTLTDDVKLQWGYNQSETQIKYGINYRNGPCKLFMNIPSTIASGFESDIYVTQKISSNNSPETKIGSFVISSGCVFEQVYLTPNNPLSEIKYSDLTGITSKGYYIPSMIPGGDYKITNDNGEPKLYFMAGSETKMTADRCRQPWRLSHYVRSNYNTTFNNDTDLDVVKIAYNTAAALVFNASMDTTQPGRLTLNVDMCNLTNNYDGYCGDLIPPLLALIDALQLNGYSLEPAIIKYANDIKGLNNGVNTKATLIAQLNNNSSTVYPVLDSITSGGQQLGLVGCGFVCTKDFLSRKHFDAMLKYDTVNSWNTYNTDHYTTYSNLAKTVSPTFTNQELADLITIYKMLAARGNGFDTYDTWASDITTTYADAILSKAYLTNLRIRNINISIVNELSFGPTDQKGEKTITTNSYASTGNGFNFDTGCKSIYSPNYVYTDFPMYGIPDSGWGSLTIEIFSYLGIAFAAMNDYKMFCKWHRTYWHLLFIQNGGDMYGWDADGGIEKQDSDVNLSSANMWLPAYLQAVDSTGINQTWIPDVINKEQLHFFTIYAWPPEKFYQSINVTNSKTRYWANRLDPYRGDDEAGLRFRWSTPSYCMGFSPAWVAGGKTSKDDSWNDNNVNRPIAEALNPFFITSAGLYSATDGDENVLQAYLLASLQWPTDPTLDETNGLTGDHNPTPPVPGTTDNAIYGYSCDVADFAHNYDIPSAHPQYNASGVKYANTTYGTENAKITVNNIPVTTPLRVTDKIGYGITYDTTTSKWKFPVDRTGKRCTTWAYIAESIQKTMISKNGCGFSGDFGNFSPLPLVPSVADPDGARFETLGHDTNASDTTTKLDYIDARLYQICKHISGTTPVPPTTVRFIIQPNYNNVTTTISFGFSEVITTFKIYKNQSEYTTDLTSFIVNQNTLNIFNIPLSGDILNETPGTYYIIANGVQSNNFEITIVLPHFTVDPFYSNVSNIVTFGFSEPITTFKLYNNQNVSTSELSSSIVNSTLNILTVTISGILIIDTPGTYYIIANGIQSKNFTITSASSSLFVTPWSTIYAKNREFLIDILSGTTFYYNGITESIGKNINDFTNTDIALYITQNRTGIPTLLNMAEYYKNATSKYTSTGYYTSDCVRMPLRLTMYNRNLTSNDTIFNISKMIANTFKYAFNNNTGNQEYKDNLFYNMNLNVYNLSLTQTAFQDVKLILPLVALLQSIKSNDNSYSISDMMTKINTAINTLLNSSYPTYTSFYYPFRLSITYPYPCYNAFSGSQELGLMLFSLGQTQEMLTTNYNIFKDYYKIGTTYANVISNLTPTRIDEIITLYWKCARIGTYFGLGSTKKILFNVTRFNIPMWGTFDTEWNGGSITMEIHSYQMINAVLTGRYDYFCYLHRFFYYCLYLLNNGPTGTTAMGTANERSDYKINNINNGINMLVYPLVSYCAGYNPDPTPNSYTSNSTNFYSSGNDTKYSVSDITYDITNVEKIASASDADTNIWLAYYLADLASKRGSSDPVYGGFADHDNNSTTNAEIKNKLGIGETLTWEYMYTNIATTMQSYYINRGNDNGDWGHLGNFSNSPNDYIVTNGNSSSASYQIHADYVDLQMYKKMGNL